jgi:imidazolonepropionase-like amidohydrolase
VTLEAGFTTVRNVGASGYSDIALRDAIKAGDVPGPRMLVSGPALGITGGHADNNFLAPQYHWSDDGVADGVDGVTLKVREDIKYGADVIKFMATGGVLSEGDNPALAQYSPEEMKAIVDTAHGLGRKVAAHAHGATGIKYAVLAGVDSIEHGSYINDEDIQLMKQRGTYLVPTVYLEDWLTENLQTLGLTPSMIEKAKIVLPIAQKNISHAFREGVKVAFGTDAAVYPHGLNAHEFGKMVSMGLTPLQSIQAATVNAADLIGWSDRVGTLETGKFADIVAVQGDPLADVHLLESVRFVTSIDSYTDVNSSDFPRKVTKFSTLSGRRMGPHLREQKRCWDQSHKALARGCLHSECLSGDDPAGSEMNVASEVLKEGNRRDRAGNRGAKKTSDGRVRR